MVSTKGRGVFLSYGFRKRYVGLEIASGLKDTAPFLKWRWTNSDGIDGIDGIDV